MRRKGKRGPRKGAKYRRRVEADIRSYGTKGAGYMILPAHFKRAAMYVLRNIHAPGSCVKKFSEDALSTLQTAAEAISIRGRMSLKDRSHCVCRCLCASVRFFV